MLKLLFRDPGIMACALKSSCEICMNSFNEADRKTVALPCGHDFCLTCLVRLKTAGNQKCPNCRGDWAELDVQALPGMALDTEARGEEEEDLLKKLGKEDGRCRNHDFAYDFWSSKRKEFYCKKCVIEPDLRHSELQLIEDAVSAIKSDIGDKVVEANEQLNEDLKRIDDIQDDFKETLRCVSEYRERLQKVEGTLEELISGTEALRSNRLSDSVLAKKVDDAKEKIKSEADISLMVSSRAILDSCKEPCVLPVLQEPEALVCTIARTFMEIDRKDALPSSDAFIDGLMKATGNGVLMKALLDADKMKKGGDWRVYATNWLAALLALADRQPTCIELSVCHDKPEPLPAAAVAAMAKAAKSCGIRLELLHSFIRPEHHSTDQELLEHIVANSSLSLISFCGHLDAAGIAKLPTTVVDLTLAFSGVAEARAISGLKPWDALKVLDVSISSNVAPCDLRPLPRVSCVSLYFPGLTDARVDSVRPAIETLVPGLKLGRLVFPLSQLTAAGTRRLVQQLRGVHCYWATIEPCGSWRPREMEKERIKEEFRSALGINELYWDLNWLYV